MKIIVAIKRVIDYRVKVRLKSDSSGVETHSVKHSMNPFDEIALEEAVRLLESGVATEVVAVTIGETVSQEILRTAYAMGATRAIWVDTPVTLSPQGVAKALAALVKQEDAQLILLGKQAIDDDSNQVGQMLAGYLSCAQATFASKLSVSDAKDRITVSRETDRGIEVIDVALPAVVTADLRLNTPRFISLPNIMKAKSRPIESMPLTDLGVSMDSALSSLSYSVPPQRQAGQRVASLDELMPLIQEYLVS